MPKMVYEYKEAIDVLSKFHEFDGAIEIEPRPQDEEEEEDQFAELSRIRSAATAAGFGPSTTQFTDFLEALPDQKLTAIKIYREITGVGLKEAKDAVDGIVARIQRAF